MATTNNGAGPTPKRQVRRRSVTFSIGDDVYDALYALFPTGRSELVDTLLREQPAIRAWLEKRAAETMDDQLAIWKDGRP